MQISKYITKSYTRFLISNIIILFLVILTIFLVLSKTVLGILHGEIKYRDKTAQKYSTFLLDYNLEDCIKISENLVLQDKILPFDFNKNKDEGTRIINTLNNYTNIENFCDEIFIYFHNDNYIYSNTKLYNLDDFYSVFFSDDVARGKIQEVLTSSSSPSFVKDSNTNTLYFAVPYISENQTIGSVLFSINNETLYSIINSIGLSRYFFIIDNDNNIINITNQDIAKYENGLSKYILSIKDNLEDKKPFTEVINKYNIFFNKLDSVDLYYFSATPLNSLFGNVYNVSKLIIITVLLTFIIGSIVIFILVRLNYKPINHLKELSEKLYVKDDKKLITNSKNEFDLIENTIYFLSERNTELEYEISKNIPLMQSVKLTELINGTVYNSERFLIEASELGLNLFSKYHVVILLKSKNPSALNNISLSEILSKYNIQNFSFNYEFLVNKLFNELCIFLVGVDSPSININSRQILDENNILSIGSVQNNINLIGKSYIDARTNLEVINKSNLIKNFINKYDIKLKDLTLLLYNNEIDQATIYITKLISDLKQEKLPFKLVRSVYFEIVIIYNNYVDKNKHIINFNHVDLSTLYQINTLDELTELFLELTNELFILIRNKDKVETPALTVEKIKEYILENYTDHSFSLQLVSDKFNISLSYLSQYFKDKTGITILDYITDLKMTKAKHLLLTTNLTLKDISYEVGYINVSSFIRRFKQVTSMTPGEFKRKFK